jgi:protein SCO1
MRQRLLILSAQHFRIETLTRPFAISSLVALGLACGLLSSLETIAPSAHAGQTASELANVSAEPAKGSRLPIETVFTNEQGDPETLSQALGARPAVLLFVDYRCKNMCSAILALTTSALENSGLVPKSDFGLLAIGLAPNYAISEMREFKDAVIGDASSLSAATHFLTSDAAGIAKTAASAGYRYRYDAENRQFAHPAMVLIVSGDGRVSGALPATRASGDALRLALLEARRPSEMTSLEAIRLLCYGYSPSHGLLTGAIWLALRISAAATALLLVAGILLLHRRWRALS